MARQLLVPSVTHRWCISQMGFLLPEVDPKVIFDNEENNEILVAGEEHNQCTMVKLFSLVVHLDWWQHWTASASMQMH